MLTAESTPPSVSLPFNPNHNLWRNGRLWWVAFTVLEDGWRQERIRLSLKTDDVEEARRRRDELIARYHAAPHRVVVRRERAGRQRPQ